MKRHFYFSRIGILVFGLWLSGMGSGVAQEPVQPQAKEKSGTPAPEAKPESAVPR